MTTAQVHQLAERFGMTTADRIKAPKRPVSAGDGPKQRERWAPAKKERFHREGFAAVYFAGGEGIEPRFLGDNLGGRPIRLGTTVAWEDSITSSMDGQSAWHTRRLLFRIWTTSGQVVRLLRFCEGLIRDRIEQGAMDKARKSWVDFGPDTDVALFQFELHTLAKQQGIEPLWDDEGLSAHLDGLLRERDLRVGGRR